MKKNRIRCKFLTTAFILALGASQAASAAIISSSLGNIAPGFADGATPDVPTVGTAQGGQPAPFDTSYGVDVGLFGATDFSASWMHNFGAIADPILSASLTIGIYDHDSSASGSQLALFDVDGNDLTPQLDVMFEVPGDGLDSMYNVYSIDLAGLFADLGDGSVNVVLDLTGPGLVPCLPLPFNPGCASANPFSETGTNGANLIFSTLTIETRDTGQIPVPGTLLLFGLGMLGLGLHRRKTTGHRGA